MQITEFVVAVPNGHGGGGLFLLVYGDGQIHGLDPVRSKVARELHRTGVDTRDGFVVFTQDHRSYQLLRRAALHAGPAITMNGLAPNDPLFTVAVTQHPDFEAGSRWPGATER